MGLKHSKHKKEEIKEKEHQKHNTYLEKSKELIKHDLDNNIEEFLVNNLLMCVQFFENYEREIKEIRDCPVNKRECELNNVLKKHRKYCQLPDVVTNLVNKRVKFRPEHGPNKEISESLVPQRMFIFHDVIEITKRDEEDDGYAVLEEPVHQCILEEAPGKKGYVKLERIAIKTKANNAIQSEQNTETKNTHEINTSVNFSTPASENSVPKLPSILKTSTPGPMTPNKETKFHFPEVERRSSISKFLHRSNSASQNKFVSPRVSLVRSLSRDNFKGPSEPEEETYMYTSITSLTSTKSLQETRAGVDEPDLSALPDKCIITKTLKNENMDDEGDDESENLFKYKYYINSQEFFKHFADVFNKGYEELGFSKEAMRQCCSQGSIIYINKEDGEKSIIKCEIYPALVTPWPGIATEWYIRIRNRQLSPWPTDEAVDNIYRNKAALLPIGYMKKRGTNEEYNEEWSTAFPYAEKYLENRLTHSQMRCYLFILLLYKTFIEQPNPKLGLSPHHIRTMIFWECEKNWTTWREENLGAKMLKIFHKIYERLSESRLRDYFVRDRNLLENTPTIYLNESRRKLFNILEKPFFHTLFAIRNLRYTNDKFFPKINIYKLIEILEEKNSLTYGISNSVINKKIVNNRRNAGDPKEDKGQRWKRIRRNRIQNDQKRREQERIEKDRRERKRSIEEINVEFPMHKVRFDDNRKAELLHFFVTHIIEIAKYNMEYKAYLQALTYLNYVEALTYVWLELPAAEFIESEDKILETIKNLKLKCRKNLKPPPQVPSRSGTHMSNRNSLSESPMSPILIPGGIQPAVSNSSLTFVEVHTPFDETKNSPKDSNIPKSTPPNDSQSEISQIQPVPTVVTPPERKRPASFHLQEIIPEVNEEQDKNSPNNSVSSPPKTTEPNESEQENNKVAIETTIPEPKEEIFELKKVEKTIIKEEKPETEVTSLQILKEIKPNGIMKSPLLNKSSKLTMKTEAPIESPKKPKQVAFKIELDEENGGSTDL